MNKRIKSLITALAVAATSIFGSIPAYAATGDGISVSGSKTLNPGDEVTVSVQFPSVTELLQGVAWNFKFDPTVFNVVEFTPPKKINGISMSSTRDNKNDDPYHKINSTGTEESGLVQISAVSLDEDDPNEIDISNFVMEAKLKVLDSAKAGTYQFKIDTATVTMAKYDEGKVSVIPKSYTDTVSVTVEAKAVAVKSISLDKTTLSLDTGKTATLTATVLPADATDKTVTWKSSDEKVATVANGVVTAKQEGEATITATAGDKSTTCTVTVKCGHANTTVVPAVASTCETKGHAAYTKCNDCGKVIDGSDEELPLADHVEGTPATCKAQAVCSVCKKSYGEKADHAYGTLKAKVEATCTEDGMSAYYQCSTCNTLFDEKKAEVKSDDLVIKALGHTGGTANCVDKAVCERCGTEYGDVDATNHKSVKVTKEATEATCTAEGNTEEQKCTACDTVIKESTVIAKIPHTGGTANCTDKAVCSVCDQPYGEVDPFTHKSVEVTKEATAATCAAEGNTEEQKCTACGVVVKASEVIAKLPHTTGDWSSDDDNHWRECSVCGQQVDLEAHDLLWVADAVEEGTDPTMHAECGVCGYKGQYNTPIPESTCEHKMTMVPAKPSTCTVKGNKEYYTCSECEKMFRDEKGLNEITDLSKLDVPVIDHDYSVFKYDENSHWKVCSMCGSTPDDYVVAGHTFGEDGKCECGYEKPAEKPDEPDEPIVPPTTSDPDIPACPPYSSGSAGTSGTGGSSSTTPDNTGNSASSDEPQIMGKNGKKGWTAIKSEIEKTKSGGKVTIDMNGATTLPKSVLSALKGNDIDLVIDLGNGIKWTINGKDVSSAKDIDLAVEVYTDNIPDDVIDGVADGREYVQLSLAYSGKFGFKATLSIDLGDSNNGKYANLFCYNDSDSLLEYESSAKISAKGIAKLVFSHASEWVIIIDDVKFKGEDVSSEIDDSDDAVYDDDDDTLVIPDDSVTVVVGNPDDANPVTGAVLPITLAILSLTGGTAAFTAKRKNKK